MAESKSVSTTPERSFRVLGVRVDAVQIDDVVRRMQTWIQDQESGHYISVTGMHGVTEALHDQEFTKVLNTSSLVVPDGMPLVWIGRRRGFPLARRVYGPELMETFCAQTASEGCRHFLYGGAPHIAERLADRLTARFPGLQIAGTFCPPFRALTQDEDMKIVDLIQRSHADVVWVGLSTPKQERWMFEHKDKLGVPVLIGVGAAFDFHAGRMKQAPRWMRENGFEWLFRLAQEPRRLWRRYILNGSEFVFNLALQELGLRRFD
jgi:N-acetylglucosaminyldiphosphoundecaprenol N-acetyl-beta-D-mannosaminyltransferase